MSSLKNKKLLRIVVGLAIITACFLLGDFIKQVAGLILPGSVLGMFVLLLLLGARVVRLEWVEEAAKLLIFVLPVCFVTLYVRAGADHELWKRWGLVIAGTLTFSIMVLWIVVGRLAQWLFKKETRG
jgi:holin-like protein